jgi:hypothetical protein
MPLRIIGLTVRQHLPCLLSTTWRIEIEQSWARTTNAHAQAGSKGPGHVPLRVRVRVRRPARERVPKPAALPRQARVTPARGENADPSATSSSASPPAAAGAATAQAPVASAFQGTSAAMCPTFPAPRSPRAPRFTSHCAASTGSPRYAARPISASSSASLPAKTAKASGSSTSPSRPTTCTSSPRATTRWPFPAASNAWRRC